VASSTCLSNGCRAMAMDLNTDPYITILFNYVLARFLILS
jgi:hypothetical protein